MKLLLLSLCAACACADVSHLARAGADVSHLARAGADVSHLARARAPAPVGIVSQQLDVAPDGAYQWSYEAEDGTKSGARGDLKDISAENPALSVQGESSYRSPEGEQVSLQYVADENGYQPQGSHIPTAPPIPDYIARALQYIIDHPPKPDN